MTGDAQWFAASVDNAVLLSALRRLVAAPDDTAARDAAARLLGKAHLGEGILDTLQASADLAERATQAAEELRAQVDALTTENGLLRETLSAVPTDGVDSANELLHYRREIAGLHTHINHIYDSRRQDREAAQARLAELESELGLWSERFQEADRINARLLEERDAVIVERDREQAHARRQETLVDELDGRCEEHKLTISSLREQLRRVSCLIAGVGLPTYEGENDGLVRAVREALERLPRPRPVDPLDDARREASGLAGAKPLFDVLRENGAFGEVLKIQPGRVIVTPWPPAPLPPSNTFVQRAIWQRVVDRGYAAGYTPEQLIARQLTKLVEEVAEACGHVVLDVDRPGVSFDRETNLIERRAKARFDEKNWDVCGPVYDAAMVIPELYDCQVVLCALASVIGELTGQEIDLLRGALEKSGADVGRGVRSQDGADDNA